jgi:isopentenyl diphosphate isomerase/L-lactate dehydrogenase-like FMN-dependent dehydrogenase
VALLDPLRKSEAAVAVPVPIDSGVRSGADIAKAMAPGATAVGWGASGPSAYLRNEQGWNAD